jgi:DNA-binding CsgD family transcriptional regulator
MLAALRADALRRLRLSPQRERQAPQPTTTMEPPVPNRTPEPAELPQLTEQQLAVLRLSHHGRTIDQIALQLRLARRTIHRRLQEARELLGVDSRRASVEKARELGLLEQAPFQVDWFHDRDRTVSWDHRLYLAAFDRHLTAGDDEHRLERIKALTDAALESIGGRPGGSVAARDWLTERLLEDMAKVA